jgi:hypothetical protein
MAKYRDVPQITRGASYCVDVSWQYLPGYYLDMVKDYGLDVNPNFQRAHVWNDTQKVRYVEYILKGGKSGKDIYTNNPQWHHGRLGAEHRESWFVLVDGKQRLDAVLAYLNNEFPIFEGNYHRDYDDSLDIMTASFKWHVNELPTMQEVYRWYIDLNAGGTQHSPEEIARVQALLDAGEKYVRPSPQEILSQARLDRQIIVDRIEEEAEEARVSAARTAEREARELANPKKKRRK